MTEEIIVRDREEAKLIRTKRKCLVIVTAVGCICVINYQMAQRYDGDDMIRSALSGIVASLATWFGTSMRSAGETKIG